MKCDFSGYATRSGIRCSDGRTIMPDAFIKQDGSKVPLVWQHSHGEPTNVLGHAILENRKDGVYAYGFFNDTPNGQNARTLVEHGDIKALSIYANQLVEKSKNVLHGAIREVSLVLSGANPGAFIDNVSISHSDGSVDELLDEAVIYSGEEIYLSHASDDPEEEEEEMPDQERTVADVFDEMTEEQQDVVYYLIGSAVEEATGIDDDDIDDLDDYDDVDGELAQFEDLPYITHEEAFEVSRNVFEMAHDNLYDDEPALSHDEVQSIVEDAKRFGSLKEAVIAHADTYGIDNIDVLFPDAKTVTSAPELLARRTEWVKEVLEGIKHSPFSRIKSTVADLTPDEARAKGYITGKMKKEEVIKLLKRVTTPTTVYKKQKLDRDDVLDISDFDVVAWLKGEMRLMLEEELARAILIGDGREADDEDKIDEDKLRPIAKDNNMYAHHLNIASGNDPETVIESILRARVHYRGTGTPTFFTKDSILTDMLLSKDKMGRRLYETEAALASALRVRKVVPVEAMDSDPTLIGIVVSLPDYTAGADKGGDVNMFDDFDIDYNQQKYLIETRISGALTKPKSAVVIRSTEKKTATPKAPSFNRGTNTITIPTIEGVEYYIGEEKKTGQVVITKTTEVEARPANDYVFTDAVTTTWTFTYVAPRG